MVSPRVLNSSSSAPEPVQIHLFIRQGLKRLAATCFDGFGQSDHLINRLFAREPPHEIFDDGAELLFRLPSFQIGQDLYHHGDHHVHPTGADQRESAIEVEYDDAGVSGRRARPDVFDHSRPFYKAGGGWWVAAGVALEKGGG